MSAVFTLPDTVALSAYLIDGQHHTPGNPGFAAAIASAHARHQRPRCMCQPEGLEMYIARFQGDAGLMHLVKRMPGTGHLHALDCASYEPPGKPADPSPLGSAIQEDPNTGETRLKLDFPLSRHPGRSRASTSALHGAIPTDSVATQPSRLSLRGLLHYLWDEAGLTRWHPGFAGKRSWATVRRHLLDAAENKTPPTAP